MAADFCAAVNYPVGVNPVAVAAGDFDRDGKLDVAVANAGSGTVSVFLGNGDGTFRKATDYRVGENPQAIAAGDVNGDGAVDLVVANSRSNNVTVLLGNNDGTFRNAESYSVGAGPQSLALADLTGNGQLDLVVANAGSNNIAVLLANGKGGWRPARYYPVGTSPQFIVTGDFNRDGVLDLAVANFGSTDVSVLLGNGDGTLRKATNYAVGGSPYSIAVGDLDGDHFLDLAVTTGAKSNISVLLGNGDGTFQKPQSYVAGSTALGITSAEFNGDGMPVLAVANPSENSVVMLIPRGAGTLQAGSSASVGLGPSSLAVGDFNTDGAPDLVVTNSRSNSISVLLNCPSVGLSPGALAFPARQVGTHSPATPVTLTNRGSAPLLITQLEITGENSRDYKQVNQCPPTPTTVPPNGHCVFSVTFSPEANGHRTASLRITDNAPGSPHSVALDGGEPETSTSWIGGAGDWSDPTKWTNGVPNSTTDALIEAANSAVTLDVVNAGVDNLTLDSGDSLSFVNSASLQVSGATISNAGSISLNSTGNLTYLTPLNNTTLTGAGTLTMSNNANNEISVGVGGTAFTNQSTIEGAGSINYSSQNFTNQGTINANLSTPLTITGSGTFSNTNQGLLEASSGGTLQIESVISNSGGTIAAGNGSTVQLINGTINGGTLNSSGTGAIQSNCCLQASVLNGVTNDGTFQVGAMSNAHLQGSITNAGSIQVNATTGTSSYLVMDNAVTLTGSGSVVLSDNPNNNLDVTTAGASLVNQNTIQGAGAILVSGGLSLTNKGTITATSSMTNQLIVTTNGTFTNTGTMQSANGGTLNLQGSFNNAGGTIAAGNGTTVQLVNGIINGGTLTSSGTGAIQSNCCLQASTLNGITNTGTFQVGNQSTASLQGAVINNGSIQVNATGTGSSSSLGMIGPVTLMGTGAVVMSDNPDNTLGVTNGGASLVNQSTIQGAGTINVSGGNSLTNNGTITATSSISNQLIVVASGTFTNTGTMQSANGGTLNLQGTFGNAGGTISAGNGTTVLLVNGIINGGTLTSSGTGAIQSNCCLQASTLNGITNTGTFQMGDNSSGNYLAGTIINNGSIQLNSTGHNTALNMNGAVTLQGSGSVVMSDNPNNTLGVGVLVGGASLMNQNIIQGAGSISIASPSTVTNQGSITANGTNPLLVSGSGTYTNQGAMTVNAGSLLDISSSFANFSDTTLKGGKYVVSGTFQFNGANIVTNAANLILDGTTSQVIDENGANGLANFSTNSRTGSFTLAGGRNFTAAAGLANAGKVDISSGSTLTITNKYTQTAGTSVVDGVLSAAGVIGIQAGNVFGTDTLAGNVQSSGTVTPGDSATKTGLLTITKTYTQASTGSLNISIGGLKAGTQFGQLNVTESASLDGILNISLINGYLPNLGDTFDILNAGSITGTFATVNGSCIPPSSTSVGKSFAVTYNPTSVILTVVRGPCS